MCKQDRCLLQHLDRHLQYPPLPRVAGRHARPFRRRPLPAALRRGRVPDRGREAIQPRHPLLRRHLRAARPQICRGLQRGPRTPDHVQGGRDPLPQEYRAGPGPRPGPAQIRASREPDPHPAPAAPLPGVPQYPRPDLRESRGRNGRQGGAQRHVVPDVCQFPRPVPPAERQAREVLRGPLLEQVDHLFRRIPPGIRLPGGPDGPRLFRGQAEARRVAGLLRLRHGGGPRRFQDPLQHLRARGGRDHELP